MGKKSVPGGRIIGTIPEDKPVEKPKYTVEQKKEKRPEKK